MAKTGAIIGECAYCKDLLYEGEIWILVGDKRLAHLECETKADEKDKKIADLEIELYETRCKIRYLERRIHKCLSGASTKT